MNEWGIKELIEEMMAEKFSWFGTELLLKD